MVVYNTSSFSYHRSHFTVYLRLHGLDDSVFLFARMLTVTKIFCLYKRKICTIFVEKICTREFHIKPTKIYYRSCSSEMKCSNCSGAHVRQVSQTRTVSTWVTKKISLHERLRCRNRSEIRSLRARENPSLHILLPTRTNLSLWEKKE